MTKFPVKFSKSLRNKVASASAADRPLAHG